MKWAVLTIRVPLNERYPWKTTQATLERAVPELLGNACDGIRWHDAVDQGRLMQTHVTVVEDTPPERRRSIWALIGHLTRNQR